MKESLESLAAKPKSKLAILFFFVGFSVVFSSISWAQIVGTDSLNVRRRGHTATRLDDGKILIVGGENEDGVVNQAEIFDPSASPTFSNLSSLSDRRTDHTATRLADGRVLITGGRDATSALDSTEIFDPATISFSPGPLMKRARAGHSATVLADGRILLVGGEAEGSAEIYDPDKPETERFSLVGARLGVPRTFHGTVLLKDGRVLIVGGVDASNTVLNSAELFDPQTQTFSPTTNSMGIARGLPTLRVLPDGKVQIIGGDSDFSMEIFDPQDGKFNGVAYLPPTPELLGATLSTRSRAALISPTASQNPNLLGTPLTPEQLDLLDRADQTITELPSRNQALVAGGVKSVGQVFQVLNSASLVQSSPASVTTDKTDYAPGTIVTITGKGFQPNEDVALALHERPDQYADPAFIATADGQGNFIFMQFAPQTIDIGRTFTLTAIGQSSGFSAQTAFTDSTKLKAISVIGGQTPNPVTAGNSATYGTTAATSVQLDFNGSGSCTASLSATGLPAGATATFAPSSLTGTVSESKFSLLTISTTAATPAGTTTFTIRATGTGGTGNDCSSSDTVSNTATLVVAAANSAPVVTTTAGALSYTENAAATAIDTGLTVTDADSTNLVGATVAITTNFASSEDELSFTNQLGITGSYNAGTGVMTLSGTTTVANYQTALRAVKYRNSSDNPSTATRTVTFKANDGTSDSNAATKNITVTAVNDAPVLANIEGGALSYTENDPATPITSTITVSDMDSTNLASATVQITGNYQNGQDVLSFTNTASITGIFNAVTGTMTLTGSDTVANYQAALRAVKYQNTSDNPSTLTRTVTFQVNDGAVSNNLSNTQTRNITVIAVNDAPVLANIEGGALSYTENDPATPITSTITVSDVDSTNLASATVQITGNYQNGQDVLSFTNTASITGIFNAATGTMTLTGSDTVANYQAALRAVKYQNTSDNPSTLTRTVTFQVNDGAVSNNLSNTQTRNITVIAVNNAPVVTTSAGALSYTENDAATAIDAALTVTDADSTNLASATVQITGNYQNGQDVLSFTNTASITGSFNATTGAMTLTGSDTVANYQAALRAVKYQNTSDNPSTLTRTVTFKANDGTSDSNAATKNITVTAVNDAPVVTTTAGALAYTENDAATAIDTGLTVTDADSANLVGATVAISSNFASGEDELSFTNQLGITGSYNAGTGVMTLSGTTTVANYQTALRAVKYRNSSDNPSTLTRTVTFTVDDGGSSNNTGSATRNITVIAVNDAPVLANIEGGALSYTENDPATPITSTITVSDVDSTNLASATVQITGNYQSGQDVLSFTNTASITGSFNATTGTMTLTGSDTVANYQAALRSVTYFNNSDNPSTLTRTVTFQVNDGAVSNNLSNTQTRNITVIAVNDAPVANNDSYSTNEDTLLSVAAPGVLGNDTDVDSASLTAVLVSGPTHGTLSLNADGSFSYTPAANYNGSDSFIYKANDGSLNSYAATVTITVNAVNDRPTADNKTVSTNEDTALPITLSGSDVESCDLTFSIVTPPSHGSLSLITNNACVSGTPNTDTATVTYTPDSNYNGPDSFSYKVTDTGDGSAAALDSYAATVSITVNAVNDKPTANGQSVATNEDTPKLITLSGSDIDSPSLSFSIMSGPSHGSLSATNGSMSCTAVPNGTGTPGANCTADITYTPAANFNGSDSFTFKVNDGSLDSYAATVSITVNPVNDPPSFVKGPNQLVLENAGPQTVPGWATSISAGPSDESWQSVNFIVSNNNNGLFSAQPAVAPDGTLTYTPVANTVGSATVTLQIHDNGGTANGGADTSGTQTFTITVAYDFTGFFRPIDNLPTLNVVKAGSAVPVKFSLHGYQGMSILANGYPGSASITCDVTAQQDLLEETVTAGNSSLSYDATTDQYIYVWKTDKSWTGCRQLVLRLSDGTYHWANFKFAK